MPVTGASGLDPDAARRATIAGLREKLARLGGLAGARPAPVARPARVVPRQPGFEPEETAAGTAWVRRIDVDLEPLLEAAGCSHAVGAAELLRLTGGWGAAQLAEPSAELAVLDIESLGLRGSGVVAFLVGVGLLRDSTLEVHQVLLVDPGEEAALLHAVLDRLAGTVLVTYNGRTFDLPALRARCIVNRLGDRGLEGRPHCDLLGPVRRLFRDRLGPCTLRQAEIGLLAMERVDDVPGSEAPGRYRAWLRGAGPEVLDGVVRHNELDLCATAVLGARLAAHVAGRMVEPVHPADPYRLALHLQRDGQVHRAAELLRDTAGAGVAPWDRRAAHRLAAHLRRSGGAEGASEALMLWRRLWRADPTDLCAARSLAVALERRGALDEALAVSEHSLRLCTALPAWRHAGLRNAPAGGWQHHWEHRIARLHSRLDRQARRAAIPTLMPLPA